MNEKNATFCDSWSGLTKDDTVPYINSILLAAVNCPCAIFAFLSNLAVIVTVAKNPSLQRPSNILLCSLAFTDFLTAVTAQPMFIVWRLVLPNSKEPCSNQLLIFYLYYISYVFTACLAFLNVTIMSFDRHYAVSKPLVYMAEASKEGAIKRVTFAGVVWLIFTALNILVLPPFIRGLTISIWGVLFFVAPPINYVRTWLAIVHHNRQVADNVVSSQQLKAVLQREKKVFRDMLIVTMVLFASLVPGILGSSIMEHLGYYRGLALFLPWARTMSLAPSTINPLIYFVRNEYLRNAFKSMVNI